MSVRLSRRSVLAVGLGAMTSPALAQQPAALSGKITLSGSTTVSPLVLEIGKRFEKQYPGVRIDVQTGGSSRGINDAIKGLVDIGMSSRALNEKEKTAVASVTLANDGVCMLVHSSNPIRDLTDAQIRTLYTGGVKNWKELGGKDAPITVINRADGRAELEQFREYFKLGVDDIKATLISGENQHGIKTVAGDPNAVIYMSVGASEYAAANGEKVKPLRWNGIEATSANVANGTLPVTRPLILAVREASLSPLARAFVEYARAPAARDLVVQFGYVPLK